MDQRPFILAETTAVPGLIRGGLVLLALWMIGCGPGESERVSPFQPAGPVEFNHDHPRLHKALQATVKDGWADYASLRRGNADLDAFLQQAALVPRDQFNGWARAERLAFLLNIYNASMLRLVATSEPVDNVKDLGTWRQSVWDKPAVDLFGRRHSLGELEHDMIRGQFKSPQVHFALVCGAQSCPPLRAEPYTADKLESQFADQACEFLRDDQKNRVDLDKKIVYLSQIFSWFRDDFGKTDADILEFVAPHLGEAAATEIRKGGFSIQYTEYDWTLNDASRKN